MTLLSSYLLSALIWFPVVGGVLVLAVSADRNADRARWTALGVSVATFLLSIPLWSRFDRTSADMQFVERTPWIERFQIEYFLGVDGISVPLVLLTTLLTMVVVVAGWRVIKDRVAQQHS